MHQTTVVQLCGQRLVKASRVVETRGSLQREQTRPGGEAKERRKL